MKKLWILPILLLCLLLGACQSSTDGTYTSQLKLNIAHINEEDETKNIQISYPIFGGIDDKEVVTIINTSISNYVNSEYEEFQNALVAPNQDVLSATTNTTDQTANDTDTNIDTNTDEGTDEEATEDGTTDGDGAKSDKKQEQISLLMNFKITYNKNDYLCVVQSYEKTLADNVQFNGQRSFFFSLANATYLSISEVFDFDNGFAEYVNGEITEQLENGAYATYDGESGFNGISRSCSFYIDSNNLYLYYNALEISPDKDVVPTFVFDLKDVKKYLQEDYTNIF